MLKVTLSALIVALLLLGGFPDVSSADPSVDALYNDLLAAYAEEPDEAGPTGEISVPDQILEQAYVTVESSGTPVYCEPIAPQTLEYGIEPAL